MLSPQVPPDLYVSKVMILEALKRLKAGEIQRRIQGICHNVESLLAIGARGGVKPHTDIFLADDPECTVSHFLNVLTEHWPKYSGKYGYPVPSPWGVPDPVDVYNASLCKWQGEYGKLRFELLDFLIKELENGTHE